MTEKDLLRCELLVLRWRRGDQAAATELTEMFHAPLLYYLRRLLGSEADAWDAAQETWLAVLRKLSKIREPRTLPAFLYRTARNAALAHLRKQRAADAALLVKANAQETELSMANHEEEMLTAEEAAQIHAGLEQLSLAHREVLTLYFLEDLSLNEIAEVLDISLGTVKSRLFHAKRALRSVLSCEGH